MGSSVQRLLTFGGPRVRGEDIVIWASDTPGSEGVCSMGGGRHPRGSPLLGGVGRHHGCSSSAPQPGPGRQKIRNSVE